MQRVSRNSATYGLRSIAAKVGSVAIKLSGALAEDLLHVMSAELSVFRSILDKVPPTFEINGGDGRPSVTVPLAISNDGDEFVALEVRLWRQIWRGVECHEFKFAIVKFDDRSGESAVIFDRHMASGYVENVRHLIMPTVCEALKALVSEIKPEVIYRATYFCNPPPESLRKHEAVTEAIETLGYSVALSETDGHGRVFWIMMLDGDD